MKQYRQRQIRTVSRLVWSTNYQRLEEFTNGTRLNPMSSSCYIVKSLLTRVIFASHIIVSVWWVVKVTLNDRLWYLAFFEGLLFLETLFSVFYRRGQEYKW